MKRTINGYKIIADNKKINGYKIIVDNKRTNMIS